MESISKILDAISAESRAEADKIIENGASSSREMRKLYEKEADMSRESIIKEAEKKAEEIRQRSVSQAGIESRNIKLSARREMLEKAFAMAEDKLAALDKADKKALYEKYIAEYSESDEITVQLNKSDSDEFGSKLKVKGININLDKNPGNFSGGLIIKEAQTETNCTFGVIVENTKKEMESEIAAVLFS